MTHQHSNLFISQNTDLINMLLAGISVYWCSIYVPSFTLTTQLIICGIFGLFAGLFNGKNTKALEWCLCFLFGGLLSACAHAAWPLFLSNSLELNIIPPVMIQTGTWYAIIMAPLILGFFFGSIIGQALIGDYWKQKSICS